LIDAAAIFREESQAAVLGLKSAEDGGRRGAVVHRGFAN